RQARPPPAGCAYWWGAASQPGAGGGNRERPRGSAGGRARARPRRRRQARRDAQRQGLPRPAGDVGSAWLSRVVRSRFHGGIRVDPRKYKVGQTRRGKNVGSVVDWKRSGDYTDIIYETAEGIAKITINRPEVHNAFRPQTLFELQHAFNVARDDSSIGVIILTGAGDKAFCSGGDQKIRGDDGYLGDDEVARQGIGRLNVLDLQVQIRRLPKPVIAMVAGYSAGGGDVLQICCDLTIAADHARFGQTGPKVGSFDGGYGSWLLAQTVGLKKAREIWYLCRQYTAQEALEMGMVNAVVPLERLEEETVAWARELLEKSPLAIRMLKGALNAVTDGAAGMQQFAGDATMLYYMSEEAQEGRDAFKEKRRPRFDKFPRRP